MENHKKRFVDRMILISLIILINTFATASFAKCIETKREIYAPAIINENASQMILIAITIRENNENGSVLYELEPTIGIETQESILTADSIAREIAAANGLNTSDCDVIVKIADNKTVKNIEGPSAGALFTVLILSGFENKTLRNDTTMTGTIERNGKIGSVGGLPLKAEAAYKLGFKQMIVPSLTNSEKIELLMLKNYYNITILQAGTVDEGYAIMASQIKGKERLELSPDPNVSYENTELNHRYKEWIKSVTEEMIKDAEYDINNTPEEYKINFESRLRNAKNAFSKNQFYTSANIAFLLSIDKETSLFSKKRFIDEYNEANKCITDFEEISKEAKIKMNSENFEIIGPAESRYLWAKIKLKQTNDEKELFKIAISDEENGFISPLLAKYKDVVNAKYWCLAAVHMINSLDAYEESYLNKSAEEFYDLYENRLEDYTRSVIANLSVDEQNEDVVFHYKSAEEAITERRYIAALVDAAYIKSYSDIENLVETIPSEYGNEEIEPVLYQKLNELISKNYNYIWPQIFINHAKTISETDKLPALRIAFIANNIEDYFSNAKAIAAGSSIENKEIEIKELILGDETNKSYNETNKTNENGTINQQEREKKAEEIFAYQVVSLFTFIAGVAFVAFIILFVIGKIKLNRKTDRTKYKKIRK